MPLAAVLFVAVAAAGVVAVVAGLQARTAAPGIGDPEAYLRSLDDEVDEADEFALLLKQPFLGRVLRPLGDRALDGLSLILPSNYRDTVHRRLLHAGLSGQVKAEEVLTGQVLAGLLGFVAALGIGLLTSASAGQQLLYLLLFPSIGALLPNVWLTRKVTERREAILKDLPDTLDLLAISVEAGVGFEGALGIVTEHFHSPLADEFSRTLKEMELGLPRREALQNMKRRTEVPELSNFVLALTQADALGMPIGRVLKTQATEMRNKRRQWAREKAAKLPVKILFPLILFIFPPVFIIVLGPAAAEIGAGL
jgi:tight adherence protein C